MSNNGNSYRLTTTPVNGKRTESFFFAGNDAEAIGMCDPMTNTVGLAEGARLVLRSEHSPAAVAEWRGGADGTPTRVL